MNCLLHCNFAHAALGTFYFTLLFFLINIYFVCVLFYFSFSCGLSVLLTFLLVSCLLLMLHTHIYKFISIHSFNMNTKQQNNNRQKKNQENPTEANVCFKTINRRNILDNKRVNTLFIVRLFCGHCEIKIAICMASKTRYGSTYQLVNGHITH